MIQTAREHQAPADDTEEQPVKPQQQEAKSKVRPAAAIAESKGRGRPATGKRSDPEYESTTVFIRKETKAAAARLLLDDKEQDLSDVLEKLFSGWVRKKLQL